MSDYAIDDSSDMVKITYELSDREIYNDVRAEIGITKTETVVDEDPDYQWKVWKYYVGIVAVGHPALPPNCRLRTYYADAHNAITWKLTIDDAYHDPGWPGDKIPYYDYSCVIDESDDSHCVVKCCNRGPLTCAILYTIKYKYLASEGSTHEEINYQTLTVRATDEVSIRKYGRRVMPLMWPQGSSENEMQMIANAALARYKEPAPVLPITIQGKNDELATQIFTREISDIISVVCDSLGMASTDFYIDRISIRDTAAGIPMCTWLLTGQRDAEVTGYFMIDTDEIDGSKLIA